MYNFLLSGAFQPFSFASCCVECRGRCGEERVGLLTVRVECFQCPVPRNLIIDGAQCYFGMCGSKRIFNVMSLVSPGFIKSFLCMAVHPDSFLLNYWQHFSSLHKEDADKVPVLTVCLTG